MAQRSSSEFMSMFRVEPLSGKNPFKFIVVKILVLSKTDPWNPVRSIPDHRSLWQFQESPMMGWLFDDTRVRWGSFQQACLGPRVGRYLFQGFHGAGPAFSFSVPVANADQT